MIVLVRILLLGVSVAVLSGLPWVAAEDEKQAKETIEIDCQSYKESHRPSGIETAEERTQRLDDEFQNALRILDQCVTVVIDSAGSSGGGASAAGGGANGGAAGGNQNSLKGTEIPQVDAGSSSELKISGTDPASGDRKLTPTPSFPIPADIPAKHNGDIVSKQIREAAEAESDPEVRSRLWDDYRRMVGIKPPE